MIRFLKLNNVDSVVQLQFCVFFPKNNNKKGRNSKHILLWNTDLFLRWTVNVIFLIRITLFYGKINNSYTVFLHMRMGRTKIGSNMKIIL